MSHSDIGQPPGYPVATVSVLDVFTRVVEMQVELATIRAALADLPDHEVRLRVLESAKAKVYGAAIALGAVAGGGASWIALALAHR